MRRGIFIGLLFLSVLFMGNTACSTGKAIEQVYPAATELASFEIQAIEQQSCLGFCGEQSAAGCWCDTSCEEFGDCCADYTSICVEGNVPIFEDESASNSVYEIGPDVSSKKPEQPLEIPGVALNEIVEVDKQDVEPQEPGPSIYKQEVLANKPPQPCQLHDQCGKYEVCAAAKGSSTSKTGKLCMIIGGCTTNADCPSKAFCSAGQCVGQFPCRDQDQDGFVADKKGTCDPTGMTIKAYEDCDDWDSKLNSFCPSPKPACIDKDRDGHMKGDETQCSELALWNNAPVGYRLLGQLDCQDNNANAYIGAQEICNGKDDNCDGIVDEGLANCNP